MPGSAIIQRIVIANNKYVERNLQVKYNVFVFVISLNQLHAALVGINEGAYCFNNLYKNKLVPGYCSTKIGKKQC